ncbi:hypothetical protein PMCN03_1811 [Pasteurella multocida subsp. multocida str. HB03]|nr:hypothetical protein PMCN03_1811 [Pasteurella multocida subsp. multocida str. HB03]ESQ72445.1 hypothetical protein P1062_0202595 [Pasteurella multocida subsp. multocida P1062]
MIVKIKKSAPEYDADFLWENKKSVIFVPY